jgi:BirA family transcriptional regulator, biotin operon repressor / biotin---[acetyl-CoA-carboxylase] ligase
MMRLDPRAAAVGVRLVAHEVLGSTNAEALKLARAGERGPLWIVAERQAAGRGRRGRVWVSERGNLFATLLLTAPAAPEHRPQLSLVAALALHDALAETAEALKPRIAIKWPNDLLLEQAKFAGILVEGEGGEDGAVAIGIGVNCASHPLNADYPATDIATAGISVLPAMLMEPLSLKMVGRLAQWNGGEGFSTVRADWMARAAGIGEKVGVRLVDRELSGIFETLDDAGALVLRLPDGHAQTITAADVVMLR